MTVDFPRPNRRGILAALGSVPLAAGAWHLGRVEAATTCVLSPSMTEGPYWVDEKLNRSDLTTGTTRPSVTQGTPLTLSINVLSYGSSSCTPAAGVQIDLWHCDAIGAYSDVSANSTVGQTFLRGYQTTDANGQVTFTTIYPGWYSGRTVHIHLRARVYDAAGNTTYNFTSQLFFDDTVTDAVFASAPYNSRGTRDTLNARDSIYNNQTSALLSLTRTASGYAGAISIGLSGLPAATTTAITPASGFWYTATAGGRGVGFELNAAGTRAYVGWYTYDSQGQDIWYAGNATYAGTTCSGTLSQYAGGTALASLGGSAATAASLGTVASFSLAFTSSSAATASITTAAGTTASYALTRYPLDGSSISSPPSWVPQTGWWYSAAYPGTGIFLESQGQVTIGGETYTRLFMVVLSYATDGRAAWYATGGLYGRVTSAGGTLPVFAGTLNEYANGPTLTGNGTGTRVAGERGSISAVFSSTSAGSVTLPSGAVMAIQRFSAF
ncbi:MAG: intradiol ring-cleavage dioxygenase [Alphaproteobacteria bacterium]|jgi:protocatechuate 3,4-dioxygenase beta subunit|nr:intradiol ring-cleavage dioxygenase [Alphaproteobacteria bacterium]